MPDHGLELLDRDLDPSRLAPDLIRIRLEFLDRARDLLLPGRLRIGDLVRADGWLVVRHRTTPLDVEDRLAGLVRRFDPGDGALVLRVDGGQPAFEVGGDYAAAARNLGIDPAGLGQAIAGGRAVVLTFDVSRPAIEPSSLPPASGRMPYYSFEEAATELGATAAELEGLVAGGRLQAFRDEGDEIKFRQPDIDELVLARRGHDPFASFDEAASELGLSGDELDRLVSGGEIEAHPHEATIRFKRSDIECLKAGERSTGQPEPEPKAEKRKARSLAPPEEVEIPFVEDDVSETLLDLDDLEDDEAAGSPEPAPVTEVLTRASPARTVEESASASILVGSASVAASPPAAALRRATVRYYDRMNPLANFPLLVVLSEEEIQRIRMERVAQVEGAARIEVTAEEPEIEIVPRFPGCLVTPDRIVLDITPRRAEARFHVTPFVEGEIDDAEVVIRRGKQVLDRIATPCRVSKQTLAKMTLSLSIASPVVSTFLDVFDLSVKEELPALVVGIGWLVALLGGPTAVGLKLFVALVGVAAMFYWRHRPRQGQPVVGFLDIEEVGAERPPADAAPGPPDDPSGRLAAWLDASPVLAPTVLGATIVVAVFVVSGLLGWIF